MVQNPVMVSKKNIWSTIPAVICSDYNDIQWSNSSNDELVLRLLF